MKQSTPHHACVGGLMAALSLVLASAASAQSGYAVGEGTSQDIGSGSAANNPGPVRLARVSYVAGNVAWRPSTSVEWSTASINLPSRQGSEFWARNGSRAEVQFDDGSAMQLGGGAMATLQTMYSNSNGEFSEIKQTNGLATYMIRHNVAEYQVDTPLCAVKAFGPANFRVGVNQSVEVAVRSGRAEVSGPQGSITLKAGDRCVIRNDTDPYVVNRIPAPDNWDHFSQNRVAFLTHHNAHLPSSVDLVAGNMDDYGSWHTSAKYGQVWTPSNVSRDWRPYSEGSWTWVSPVGWTWVDREPWAYAPSHYGTWAYEDNRWDWCPGPAYQYWCPAVVDYTVYDNNIGWCALAPEEVRYPATFSIGFSSGDWALSFSIGQAGCFFPSYSNYCVARPWDNGFVNREVNIYNTTVVNNYYGQTAGFYSPFWGRNRFFPRNVFAVNGGSWASRDAFVNGGGSFQRLGPNQSAFFRNGTGFVGVPTRGSQVAGPWGARPAVASFTPTRRFSRSSAPPPTVAQRPVFRSRMPGAVARQSSPMGRTFTPPARPANRVVWGQPQPNARQNSANGRVAANNNQNRPLNRSPMPNTMRTTTRNGLAVAHNNNVRAAADAHARNLAAHHQAASQANARSIQARANAARRQQANRMKVQAIHNHNLARQQGRVGTGRANAQAVHARNLARQRARVQARTQTQFRARAMRNRSGSGVGLRQRTAVRARNGNMRMQSNFRARSNFSTERPMRQRPQFNRSPRTFSAQRRNSAPQRMVRQASRSSSHPAPQRRERRRPNRPGGGGR